MNIFQMGLASPRDFSTTVVNAPDKLRPTMVTDDLSGKTIIPFLSHEGSSNGANARKTIEEHAVGSTVRFDDALSIRGGEVDSSEQAVRDWVDGLGFGK